MGNIPQWLGSLFESTPAAPAAAGNPFSPPSSSQRYDAALRALAVMGDQYRRAGQWRLNPTPPPVNFGAASAAYDASINADRQRQLDARQYELRETKHRRAEEVHQRQQDARKDMLALTELGPAVNLPTGGIASDISQGYRPLNTDGSAMSAPFGSGRANFNPPAFTDNAIAQESRDLERRGEALLARARSGSLDKDLKNDYIAWNADREAFKSAKNSYKSRSLPTFSRPTTPGQYDRQPAPAPHVSYTQRDNVPITRPVQTVHPMFAGLPPGTVDIARSLIKAGKGPAAFQAILKSRADVASRKPPLDPSIVRTAREIYPGDPAKQRDFILQSSRGTNVSINSGEVDYSKKQMADFAEAEFLRSQEAAAASQATLKHLLAFEQLSGMAPSGMIAKMTLPIRAFFDSMGLKDENLSIQQAMGSLSNQLALASHKPGMGPMTDNDFMIYEGIGPSFGKTTGGNAMIIQRLRHDAIGEVAYAAAVAEQMRNGEMVNPAAAWKKAREEVGPMIRNYASAQAAAADSNFQINTWVTIKGEPRFLHDGKGDN